MDSRYSPADIESKWYAAWEKAGAFAPKKGDKPPFTIVIPPPNITGALHMGHALNNTLQDVLIRFKRMQGYETLWQPGTDHAGIATQSVVERELQKEGKSKHDLGREKFVEKVWEWKKEYGNRIVDQLKRLGCSCDWSRARFTMDEGLSRAVREVFVRLHEDGLIYRGARLVNWCPKLQTALADEEVESKETKGHFWSIKYFLDGNPDEGIVVSTTRPETMFGDAAVAVHPEDERYRRFIGKKVLIPVIGRAIPVIGDEHADPSKGTGAVKITPAHDFNDYEVGLRHKLKPIVALGLDAKLTGEAGPYAGMDRFVARKKLVAELEQAGQLVSVEDRVIPIPTCYRSGDVVEPALLSQWYVKMGPLADEALACVKWPEGKFDSQKNVRFVPERYLKTYEQWLEPRRDWCISRQLWWGHQIPVWYVVSETGGKIADATPYVVARDEDEAKKQAQAKYGAACALKREEDVLDTWFSSALWPFSTLGWPEKTPELETHYPTDVLITARDIIYFWVARMIFSGLKFLGKAPFHTVYIHGTILDEKGQRMSKSKGNGIDPIEMIDKFGADAVRFGLMTLTTEGQDIKLSPVKFEEARNFANKLWNAARFVLPYIGSAAPSLKELREELKSQGLELSFYDRMMLRFCAESVNKSTEHLEPRHLQFSYVATKLYQFIWDDFCSYYLEIRKKDITGEEGLAKRVAVTVFVKMLKDLITILHPFMPFITEEIWSHLGEKNLLITSSWPKLGDDGIPWSNIDERNRERSNKIIGGIRQIKGAYNIPPHKTLPWQISCDNEEIKVEIIPILSAIEDYLKLKVPPHGIDGISSESSAGVALKKPPDSLSFLIQGGRVDVLLAGIVDWNAERIRIGKKLERAREFVAAQEKKLANENFVRSAPAEVVEGEREKLRSQRDEVRNIENDLAALP